MLGANHCLIFREDQRAFDHVLQFANVPGPRLCFHQLQGRRGQLRRGQARGIFCEKVRGQWRNIFGPVAQRRNFDREDANDDDELNDLLWRAIRKDAPPPPVRSYFGK